MRAPDFVLNVQGPVNQNGAMNRRVAALKRNKKFLGSTTSSPKVGANAHPLLIRCSRDIGRACVPLEEHNVGVFQR